MQNQKPKPNQNLKFHLVSDTHYYNLEKLGWSDHLDQTTVNESGAVIDAIFDWLLAHDDTDIVLIPGDLCTGGDRVNSDGLLPKLRRLAAGGKRVFVLTASHDYHGYRFPAEEERRPNMLYRPELYELYKEFGFERAISRYEPDPLSYVAQLAPGYRLLALNTDGDENDRDITGLYEWAEAEIRKAGAAGEMIFAMHHYPVLPPSPIYPLLASDTFGRSELFRERLADAGLRFVFTGHTHMQNIAYMDTPAGNRLYDINTGAAVGYDAPIRGVVIDGESMTITTSSIEGFDWDLQGKSVSQYLKDSFDRMLNSIFEAANSDIGRCLDILSGEFSVDKDSLMKKKLLISLGGKFLYRLTLGGAGRMLFCIRKVPKSVRKTRVKDLIMEIVRNIYKGDEPYSIETDMGAAVYALTGRLETLAKPVLKKVELPFESLRGFVMSLLHDPGLPDNDAVLPLGQ
ncbi:MAG: metallophosphoesterase [Oscillospiraceae bacterium]|nr:metallophosphoesterase [Oscillospiraceae bacterium]